MLTIQYQSRFKKDYKRLRRQGKDLRKLENVIAKLANGFALEEKYQDHPLSGDWLGFRDCHIEPDWILIYKIDKEELILVLARSGSHSELDI